MGTCCENQMSVCELRFVIYATYNKTPTIIQKEKSTFIYYPINWSNAQKVQVQEQYFANLRSSQLTTVI